MTQTFTEKQLRFTFVLSNNSVFAGTNNNKLVVTGLRAQVDIRGSGMPAFPEAQIRVYGMLPSDMNALIALAFQTEGVLRNSVTVEANDGRGWSTAYAGQILTAQPDYAGVPDVPLVITSRMLGYESINPATATSYTGATDVATIVSNIATKMGASFENNGVQAVLSSPYFSGVLTDQLRDVCAHANIDCYQEAGNQSANLTTTIVIAPRGAPRAALPVFALAPISGLVGYPQRDSRGYLNVQAYYNPAFRQGGQIDLSNAGAPDVPGGDFFNANGRWLIGTLSHALSSLLPGGPWFSSILAYPPGSPPPVS